jgi:hypothetical protein
MFDKLRIASDFIGSICTALHLWIIAGGREPADSIEPRSFSGAFGLTGLAENAQISQGIFPQMIEIIIQNDSFPGHSD